MNIMLSILRYQYYVIYGVYHNIIDTAICCIVGMFTYVVLKIKSLLLLFLKNSNGLGGRKSGKSL